MEDEESTCIYTLYTNLQEVSYVCTTQPSSCTYGEIWFWMLHKLQLVVLRQWSEIAREAVWKQFVIMNRATDVMLSKKVYPLTGYSL